MDIVQSAQKFVPDMKARGADIIVALAHTGINSGAYTPARNRPVRNSPRFPAWT